MFADLNIPVGEKPNAASIKDRLLLLHKFGYGAAAVAQTLVGRPGAAVVNITGVPYAGVPSDFKQYSRITVHLDDQKDAFMLNGTSPHIKGFDIVAVRPANEKLFAQCCGTLDVDIISLDLASRLPYFLKVCSS